ncbi:uncharacterized protein V6R79_014169 [Siganus canaliculatus]
MRYAYRASARPSLVTSLVPDPVAYRIQSSTGSSGCFNWLPGRRVAMVPPWNGTLRRMERYGTPKNGTL